MADKTAKLLSELDQFTGTTQWFRHPIFNKCLYTDGVQYLAKNAQCYWLLDHIFSNQSLPKVKNQAFQVWKILVKENKATIKFEDGNDNVIMEFKIPYTDFPLAEFTLWFIDNVLLLPSEY